MEPIPVTVLTGYLGAGKTTLLNRILSEEHGRKYAVIVNEFGELGIDNDLVVDVEEDVFEMNNGCICCKVRGDLVRILTSLIRRKGRFDGVLVETTGLADPAPVAQTFFVDEQLRERTRLDGIVTVVDALNIEARLSDSPEAREQVAFADSILLNKVDLVSPADLARVEARLKALNPIARITRTQLSKAPLAAVLDLGGFDLTRLEDIGRQEDEHDHDAHCHDEHCDHPGHHHAHDHDHGHDHHHDHGHDHGHHHDHPDRLGRHDDDIKSRSVAIEQKLDAAKVKAWLDETAQVHGPGLLRWKGILHVRDLRQRLVFQGVHMIVDTDLQRDWKPQEDQRSRAVFIGKELDFDALEAGLKACVA